MPRAPIIYNLFPLLSGSISDWEDHLERIAQMEFNWIYVNPFHQPGFSGSLYAVKDYFSVNPLFVGNSQQAPLDLLNHFIDKANSLGLEVMMDLVINHTASDSLLVVQHPNWFARNMDGSLKHPSCIDPADDTKVTVWSDLAELEFWPPPDLEGFLAFFGSVVAKYLAIGFKGFRCDTAYKIPGDFWSKLIAVARAIDSEVLFLAEILGSRLPEVKQLRRAGFDFLYNSSKWWDFQAKWCLEQYRANRHIAPSISFPETHDTPRLIAEAGGSLEVVCQRYLFGAFFSAGIMMPMGYEYGFTKRLDVVHTRPADWQEQREQTYDLTEFITQVNHMKNQYPVLQEEGPIRRLTRSGKPVVILLKSSDVHRGKVLAVINATSEVQHEVMLNWSKLFGKSFKTVMEITPRSRPIPPDEKVKITLEPSDIRIFYVA